MKVFVAIRVIDDSLDLSEDNNEDDQVVFGEDSDELLDEQTDSALLIKRRRAVAHDWWSTSASGRSSVVRNMRRQVASLLRRQRYLIPSRARVLVDVADVNDNVPHFVLPDQVAHSVQVLNTTRASVLARGASSQGSASMKTVLQQRAPSLMFEANKTFTWSQWSNSSENQPLLIVSRSEKKS